MAAQKRSSPAMYVCVCNAIRDSELRHVARQTEGDVEAVYASLGCEPQCCMCLEEAAELIDEERSLDRRPRLVAA
jgi:bacterioferritin-associated ferredoxin